MPTRTSGHASLAALADPTRRAIFDRLADGPAAVGELAGDLPVSRSAVSQHLRVLKIAGLVFETAQGTRRIYRIDPRGLGALREWLDAQYSQALEAFAAFSDAQKDATKRAPRR